VTQSQFVTVPILDSRLAELRADFRVARSELEKKIEVTSERTRAEVVRWVFLVMLGNLALSAGAAAVLNALQHSHQASSQCSIHSPPVNRRIKLSSCSRRDSIGNSRR